jgi:hypothetical protein
MRHFVTIQILIKYKNTDDLAINLVRSPILYGYDSLKFKLKLNTKFFNFGARLLVVHYF